MKYDILIVIAEKDFVKLQFVYESIVRYLKGFNEVHCISNVEIPKELSVPGIKYHLDKDVIDFDFSRFRGVVKARTGWYKQQFIKLFQTVTSDNYLVVDSDVWFNKKIDVIKDGKPSFLFGRDQFHFPYFRFTRWLLEMDKLYDYSFINEVMFFKRSVITHMLSSLGLTPYGFFHMATQILNIMDDASGMSEYELYGNYVFKNFKDTYNYVYLKTHGSSKRRAWREKEIKKHIDSFKGTDYDIITMHTWI